MKKNYLPRFCILSSLSLVTIFLLCSTNVHSISITVTSPTPRAILYEGNTYTIQWTTQGIPASATNITIEIQHGAYILKRYSDNPNTGSEQLTIPLDLSVGNDYQINIYYPMDATTGVVGYVSNIGIVAYEPPAPTLDYITQNYGQQGTVVYGTIYGTDFDFVTGVILSSQIGRAHV